MAIAALEHARVQFVAEFDVTRIRHLEIHLLERMAFDALFGLEGLFAVMAGAAGSAFFHLRHRDRLFCSHIVDLGMADGAVVRLDVLLVAEGYRSRLLHFHGYVGNFVTFDAIFEIEGPLAVVAGAAGFAILHIRHGVMNLFPEVVNCIMASFAVILDALLPEMIVMVEDDLAEICYFKGDIFDVDRICEGACQHRYGQDEKQIPLLHDRLQKNKRTESPPCDAVLYLPCYSFSPEKIDRHEKEISHTFYVTVPL